LEKLKNVKNLKAKQLDLENALKTRQEKETASQKFKHLNKIKVHKGSSSEIHRLR
jgi:hypothetical protein